MLDVIVVGARVAGSSTALLLARRGLKVLVVDQASFPSDTLSTHQVQTPAVDRLTKWGVLDELRSAGTPAATCIRFDIGSIAVTGRLPRTGAAEAVYSPRRTLLDHVLLETARRSGVEVREKYQVEDLVIEEGRIRGIRGRTKGSPSASVERASFVVGADGKHSFVAHTVGARSVVQTPARTLATYSYWEDVPVGGGELYLRPGFSAGAWPTNDGLTMTFLSRAQSALAETRGDLEAGMLRVLDQAGDLGARLRAGRRVEKVRATTDTPGWMRMSHGPGWALVGDSGLVMDPVTGQGISHAFLAAELLADALTSVLQSGAGEAEALGRYARERDRQVRPMYDFTARAAGLEPDRALEVLLPSIAGREDEISRFLGVGTGSTPIPEYLSPSNLLRVVGLKGMARIAAGQFRASRLTRKKEMGAPGAPDS